MAESAQNCARGEHVWEEDREMCYSHAIGAPRPYKCTHCGVECAIVPAHEVPAWKHLGRREQMTQLYEPQERASRLYDTSDAPFATPFYSAYDQPPPPHQQP
jgi:hypothetical protein